MSRPRVAIVGRQNVGKSTLINRLHGKREAIAGERPGVTRDRLEIEASWGGRTFTLVDTGGYVRDAEGIEVLVSEQASRAAEAADLIVLVTDATTGPLEEDEDLAKRLRRTEVPVIVVANKVDTERDEADALMLTRLGLGEPVTVSALHGRGSGDLLDRIVASLPPLKGDGDGYDIDEPRFALVGRPNVGKSSLFNRLVGEERSVVYEEAGTTRDAIDAVVDLDGARVRFVDTAGLRRMAKTKGVEYYGWLRTQRAIERADVVLLVIDAVDGLTSDDKRIAKSVMEQGRGFVVAANKWDLVEDKDERFKELSRQVARSAGAQMLRTSALRAQGTRRLPEALLATRERWIKRVPTAGVNKLLEAAQGERPAPRTLGRYRYGTQVSAGPPTFVLFGGKVPDGSYQRFLENRIRDTFGFEGIPIRLRFRPKEKHRDRGKQAKAAAKQPTKSGRQSAKKSAKQSAKKSNR